jgi:site-specific DNA-methyltransferase (adenine-specific)
MADVKIDAEFAALIPPLTAAEFSGLEASIKSEGCRDAAILWRGLLLDGHNRYRICQASGIKFKTRTIDLPDRLAAMIWIRQNQAGRRNLTDDQRAMNAAALAELMGKQAKRDRAAKGTPAREAKKVGGTLDTDVVPKVSDRGNKSTAKAAKSARVSERKVRKAAAIRKKAPALAKKVESGELTLKAAEKEIAKQEKATARAAIPKDLPAATNRYMIIETDIDELVRGCHVADNSVDWIITDPPYPKEFLPLYGTLAIAAMRILKPGGGLLAMVGQSYLPEVMRELHNSLPGYDGLTYHWTLAYLTPGGQAAQLWDRKVNTFWKPVLWFIKGEYKGDWVGDVCRSSVNDNDKKHHDWGQSESGMADIIERFTLPGQTICDPFCGGGTTGVVAVKMNRLFVGIDNDPDAILTSKARLAEAAKCLK